MKQTTHIRFAAESDAAAMADLYRPYVLETVYTFEYEPPDGTAFAGRLRRTQPDLPWLAAERDGQLLGYAYASRAFERAAYGWDADLSVYLRPEAQGCGLGRTFYALLERMLVCQGYQVVYGLVTGENEGSCRFHEALGYRHCPTAASSMAAGWLSTGMKNGFARPSRPGSRRAPRLRWTGRAWT